MRGLLRFFRRRSLLDQLVQEEREARGRAREREMDEGGLSQSMPEGTRMSEADERDYRRLVALFGFDHRGIAPEALALFTAEERDRLEAMVVRMRWERLWDEGNRQRDDSH